LRVSYTKALTEGSGIECKTGLLACPEHGVILAIGLLSHTGIWALALLAVLTHITAMERMFAVWQGTHKTPEVYDAATHDAHETSTDNHHLPTMAETNEARKGRLSTAAHSCTAVYGKSAAMLKKHNGIRQTQDRTG
jgi:hypothetical protein